MSNPFLQNIWQFPIKGLAGLALSDAKLEIGSGIPDDRRFAITRGVVSDGSWLPSGVLYVNARVDNLLKFDVETTSENGIKITSPDGEQLSFYPDSAESIELANKRMGGFMQPAGVDPSLPVPQIVEQDDKTGIWDYTDTPLSIINTASSDEIGKALDLPLDPLRFRGNLVVSDLPAWEEISWIGKRIRIGAAEIEVLRPIVRCPAPGVNPQSGERDIAFAEAMPGHFGHAYCGVYAVTVKPGKIALNDTITIVGDAVIPVVEAAAEAEDYRLWPRQVELTTCEIGETTTRISLGKTGPWPLPNAAPGQRLRLHLGTDLWTTEYIAAISPGHYHLEVEKSTAADPVTEHLRTGYRKGDRIIVSGPFGRA